LACKNKKQQKHKETRTKTK